MSTPLNTKRYLCDICTFLNILCNWESFRLCVCVPLVCECVFVCLSLKNCNTICKKKGNKNYKKKKVFWYLNRGEVFAIFITLSNSSAQFLTLWGYR